MTSITFFFVLKN